GAAGRAGLGRGRSPPPGAGCRAAARASGQPRTGPPRPPPHRRAPARPGSDARRTPRGAARPEPHRPPLRLPAGDGPERGRRRLAPRRSRGRLSAPHRQVQADRNGTRLRAHREGHEPGAGQVTALCQRRCPAPGSGTTVLVIAKEPVPGRVKPRLVPPCTPWQAAALAEAALADTLHTVL